MVTLHNDQGENAKWSQRRGNLLADRHHLHMWNLGIGGHHCIPRQQSKYTLNMKILYKNHLKSKSKSKITICIPQSNITLFPPMQTRRQDLPTSWPAPRGVTVIEDILSENVYYHAKFSTDKSSNFAEWNFDLFLICYCFENSLLSKCSADFVTRYSFSFKIAKSLDT